MKRLEYTTWLLILLVFLLTNSCVDELPFNTEPFGKSINITGLLSDQLEEQKVVIRKALGLGPDEATVGDPIENASVKIIDSDDNVYELAYQGNAVYSLIMAGEEGKSYKLSIQVDGEEYETNTTIMPKGVEIDSVETKLVQKEVISSNGGILENFEVEINLTTTLNDGETPIYALYRVLGQSEFKERDNRISPPLRTCYITQNFDAGLLTVLDGSEFPNNQIFNRNLISIDYNFRFYYNFAAIVKQYSIDKETYEYWQKVGIINSERTSLFDPPPGRINSNIKCTTNIENIVYGYFTVGAKTEKIELTSALELGRSVSEFCQTFNFNRRPQECINCLLLFNSTTEKPPYWPL